MPDATTATVRAPIVDLLKNVVLILLILLISLSVMSYRWREEGGHKSDIHHIILDGAVPDNLKYRANLD